MRILVTGGAGFIASHVTDRYVALGHEVTVLDDLSTGRRENINPRVRFIQMDVRDHAGVRKLLEDSRFEVVNHHAAQMDVRRSVREPLYDAEVNILGTLNLIAAATDTHVRKMIYISTGGAVYGEPAQLPVKEDDLVRPDCQYGISKHTPEHYFYLYRRLYGLDYTVLRYPNVYGPRQNPHGEAGVIAMFAGAMLRGVVPTIYGDGKQLRDYVMIRDIVQANEWALAKAGGEIVNLGSERGTSVLELYEQIARCTGFTAAPKFAPLRPGEIVKIYLSGEKALRVLGWKAQMGLEAGIQETVAWIAAHEVRK